MSRFKSIAVTGITLISIVLTIAAFQTWILMLLFGAVHTIFPVVPPLGFWQTLLVSMLINAIGNILKPVRIRND